MSGVWIREVRALRRWRRARLAVIRGPGSRLAVVASVALIVAVPIATWWIVGDLSEPVADPDHMVRPIEVAPLLAGAVGLSAVLMVVAAAGVLARLRWDRRLDRKWLPPIAFLVVAGAIVGSGWRVVTAGVAGANIGGGLVVLLGGPLVVVLVFASVYAALLKPHGPEHPGLDHRPAQR